MNNINPLPLSSHALQLNYNPGMSQLTFMWVALLPIQSVLSVYGTDAVVSIEDAVEAVQAEIKRLLAQECPEHLPCGADDAWGEMHNLRLDNCDALISDLKSGQSHLTVTQCGILAKLFPQLGKGILILTARKEAQYGVSNPFFCSIMQEDTNARASMKVLQDLTLVDDQRPMDRLPRTGDDYDSLVVGKDISYNKSRKALENLSTAMDNLCRFQFDRRDYENVS